MLFYIYELPAKDHYIICLEHFWFEKKVQIVDLIGEGPHRLHLLPRFSTAYSYLNVHRYTLSLGIKTPVGVPLASLDKVPCDHYACFDVGRGGLRRCGLEHRQIGQKFQPVTYYMSLPGVSDVIAGRSHGKLMSYKSF